jgi:hypothetical protein
MFQTGTIIGQSGSDKNNFKILDKNSKVLYSVPMNKTQWQNFAVKLDYNKKYVLVPSAPPPPRALTLKTNDPSLTPPNKTAKSPSSTAPAPRP